MTYDILNGGRVTMTTKIYLMRHGQTLFNKLHKIQGASDSPLTAKGFAKLNLLGIILKMKGLLSMWLILRHQSVLVIH